MGTTRIRRRRTREGIELDATITEFLFTGEAERDTPGWDLFLSRHFDQGEKIKLAWRQHRPALLPEWIKQHPGTRPWAWWRFDDALPESRRRIGGKGQTMAERYPAVLPIFERGLPSSWAEIDLDDPPTFEAEAIFLDRHGLLSAAEKAYLKKHPKVLTPEKIEMEADL